jgi:integrase
MSTTSSTRRQRRSWGKIRRLTHGSGRYQASYIGPDLMRHTAPGTYTARMDAEHWLCDERRLIDRGEWTPPRLRAAATHAKAQTFIEYADAWLEHRTLKPRTRALYRELIDGPLASLHRIPLVLITPESVRAWHSGLGTATPRKREHAYQLVHAILGTAVTDGRIAANPAHIRGAMSSPAKRQAVILTPEEIAKVALAIAPVDLKALVLVAAWCGLRWGEVTELRRADISPDCSVITVARAVTHRNGACNIDSTKSARVRTVTVPPGEIRDALADHLAHHVAPQPDALLWPAPMACHYSERTFRDKFADALKAAGVDKKVRIHDLRHFAGTQAARVGNLAETMARLGHSTAKASLLYQQVAAGRDAEVAEALSKLAQH